MADLKKLQQVLGVTFEDTALLERALVHSSYANENPQLNIISNERLEFLGDAVLNLVVARKLYHDYPRLSEGEMTRLRSVLICQDTLTRVAGVIKLGDYLYMGKGEESSGGRLKPGNLSGALEAVIAAVSIELGLTAAGNMILKFFSQEIRKAVKRGPESDYKSQLQEFIQANHQPTPVYEIVATVGPSHDKIFTVEVKVGDVVVGRGLGKNKKKAGTEAARDALKRLSDDFTGHSSLC